jgi:hypothetical protein
MVRVAFCVPAVGGWWAYASSGSSESLWWGCSAAASLAFAAMAMSDMTDDNIFGHLGVKLAWGESLRGSPQQADPAEA